MHFGFRSGFNGLTVKEFLVISKFKGRRWVEGGKAIFFNFFFSKVDFRKLEI